MAGLKPIQLRDEKQHVPDDTNQTPSSTPVKRVAHLPGTIVLFPIDEIKDATLRACTSMTQQVGVVQTPIYVGDARALVTLYMEVQALHTFESSPISVSIAMTGEVRIVSAKDAELKEDCCG